MCLPKKPDQTALNEIRARVQHQLERLPLKLEIEDAAREAWDQWYMAQPTSVHNKRLDTIGVRLLALLALSSDKNRVDLATCEAVLAMLRYQLAVRRATDPLDCDNAIAGLEEKIRRVLRSQGSMAERGLRRKTNADRAGLWAYKQAIKNLLGAGDIVQEKPGMYGPAAL